MIGVRNGVILGSRGPGECFAFRIASSFFTDQMRWCVVRLVSCVQAARAAASRSRMFGVFGVRRESSRAITRSIDGCERIARSVLMEYYEFLNEHFVKITLFHFV